MIAGGRQATEVCVLVFGGGAVELAVNVVRLYTDGELMRYATFPFVRRNDCTLVYPVAELGRLSHEAAARLRGLHLRLAGCISQVPAAM